MIVSLIAALSQNRVIGKNNGLPWHLPDDMKYFMQTTKKHTVIMGRKNYDSIPEKFRPLPNRNNIIVTRQTDFRVPQCTVVHSIQQALDQAASAGEEEVFIIGGSEIYQLGMPYTRRMYLTEIRGEIQGDTYFPAFNPAEWKETSRVHHPTDERHLYPFDFVIYDRV